MIIFRYLSRQILQNAIAVSLVLTVIIVSGRMIRFLGEAAAGELSPEFILQLVVYRIPGMLVLILPLGLFLGVLLAYGRMYLESEMVVLRASGMSSRKLTLYALGPGALMAVVVASLSLYFSPLGRQVVETVYAQQKEISELDTLIPGRFQTLPGASRTAYIGAAETGENKEKELDSVFLSERDPVSGKLRVIFAEKGSQVVINPETGDRFLVLNQGLRYEGLPGEPDYQEIQFQGYGFLMPQKHVAKRSLILEAMTMQELWERSEPRYQSELHWRFSTPLLVIIVTLLAVPMSKTNPRQGRYAMMIPSILLYLLYLTLLTAAKDMVEEGDAPPIALWSVHLAFSLLAMTMMFWDRLWHKGLYRIMFWSKKKRVQV